MTRDNDQFLESIIKGNILGGLELLYAEGDGSPSEPLALNRLLYGNMEEGQLDIVREKETSLAGKLSALEDSEKALAYYNLGCFSLVQDDVVSSKDRFAQAVELSPPDLMARHNLAYAHELLAEIEEARGHYQIIQEQMPDCAITRLNLAQLSLQEGDTDAALNELQGLYDRDTGNKGLLLFLCRALLTRAEPEDVEKANQLLGVIPGLKQYPDLYECLAYAMYLSGKYDEAEQAFSELLAENEENLFARLGMIRVLCEKSDFEGVEKHTERYEELNPNEKTRELLEIIKSGP
jgi:tetratricopeptide (TPR) repeat protein